MLHHRTRLDYRWLQNGSLYMGEEVNLDMAERDGNEERVLFYRDVTTTLRAGLDISSSCGSLFPPPILKTVETLAHPDYAMGVLTELLYYEVDPGIWMPYYAKIFLGGSKPTSVVFAPALREIFGRTLGYYPHAVDSTLSHGMWTVCGMDGNDHAFEGIRHFEEQVPSAGSILKIWHSEREMIKQINESVRGLSRNRDNLSSVLVQGLTSNLYTHISCIPLVLRSKNPIRNKFIGRTPIRKWGFSSEGEPSPVCLHNDIPLEMYSHRYRDVFYAIDEFPLTDMDITISITARGRITGVKVNSAIDRHRSLTSQSSIDDVYEGHIRYIVDKLTECITQTHVVVGSPWMTLNEVYGSDIVHVTVVKSPDEIIQIRIYDRSYTLVFAMTIPSAIVKLTDTTVTCCAG